MFCWESPWEENRKLFVEKTTPEPMDKGRHPLVWIGLDTFVHPPDGSVKMKDRASCSDKALLGNTRRPPTHSPTHYTNKWLVKKTLLSYLTTMYIINSTHTEGRKRNRKRKKRENKKKKELLNFSQQILFRFDPLPPKYTNLVLIIRRKVLKVRIFFA